MGGARQRKKKTASNVAIGSNGKSHVNIQEEEEDPDKVKKAQKKPTPASSSPTPVTWQRNSLKKQEKGKQQGKLKEGHEKVKNRQKTSSSSMISTKVIVWIIVALILLSSALMYLRQYDGDESSTTSQSQKPAITTSIVHPKYQILEKVHHDPKAFSQGFELKNETHYYESVGMYGESSMRINKIATGEVTLEQKMPDHLFGEGMCRYRTSVSTNGGSGEERLIQLTWKEKVGLIYDTETLQLLEEFKYTTTNGQGWGICYDSKRHVLYVSDGSENLHTWDVKTKTEISKVAVTWKPASAPNPSPVYHLNELEYDPLTDTVLSNIWYQDVLVRIDPSTGFITDVYDLSSLFPKAERPPGTDCLNGIALTSVPNEIWVTGKYWPYMWRIKLPNSRL